MDVVALQAAKADAALRYSRRLRRADLPLRTSVNSVMSSPPTIGAIASATAITSSTLWSTLTGSGAASTPDPAAPFRWVGVDESMLATYGTTFPDYTYVVARTASKLSTAASWPYCVRFMFDGTTLELLVKNLAGSGWQILVDGQLVSASPVASTGSPTAAFLPVTFSTRQARLIEFRSGLPFGGVRTGPNDTVWKPAASRGPRCILLGDSFSGGTGATIGAVTSYVRTFADVIGWHDTFQMGIGGSGYDNVGQGTYKMIDRVPVDVTPYNPDVIVVAQGHNDTAYSANLAGLQTIVSSVFTALRAAAPKATIVCVGPYPSKATDASGTYAPMQAAIFSAAAGKADLFVDVNNTSWVTGNGHGGATTGSGNADLYIGADAIHPTQAGHDYLGQRLAVALAALLPAV